MEGWLCQSDLALSTCFPHEVVLLHCHTAPVKGSRTVVNGSDIPCVTSVHSGLPAGCICRIACGASPLMSAGTAGGKSWGVL